MICPIYFNEIPKIDDWVPENPEDIIFTNNKNIVIDRKSVV